MLIEAADDALFCSMFTRSLRMRAVHGVVVVLAVGVLGWTGAPVVKAASAGVPTQMAIADRPHGPVVGRLDSAGTFWAKAGGLSATWVHEQTGVRQIAVADGAMTGRCSARSMTPAPSTRWSEA
jgi:hypothetical protein